MKAYNYSNFKEEDIIFSNIKDIKGNDTEEFTEVIKEFYPQLKNIVLTYLEKRESNNKVKDEKFKVEIPKDMIKELLDGTAEFMEDSEGRILPSIRDKESKSIIRQVRLRLLDDDENVKKDNKHLNDFNNIALNQCMEKIYCELLEVKNLAKTIRETQKNEIRNKIKSGIDQYMLARYDNEEVKNIALLNARQTLSNGINDILSEIKSNSTYFNEAVNTNFILRAFNSKKYSTKIISEKSIELEEDLKCLFAGLYTFLEVEKELGNVEFKKDIILPKIENQIYEIEQSNIFSIMPYSNERERVYCNIKELRVNDVCQLEGNENLYIDININESV